ncbi:MAG: hypothetical protein RIS64_2948 [Bacteroidota bacterium]|jgi:hypothetical protein
MIQKKLYFILIFATFGCGGMSSRSGMAMSEEKLATLLSDLHIAEAYVESEAEPVRDSLAKRYTAQIFKKHGVTEAQFDTTMGWLARRPKLLELVYKKVTYRVEKRDSLLQAPTKN